MAAISIAHEVVDYFRIARIRMYATFASAATDADALTTGASGFIVKDNSYQLETLLLMRIDACSKSIASNGENQQRLFLHWWGNYGTAKSGKFV